MGNCVSLSISLDQSVNKVSQWLEENGGYTHNLEKNLVALKTTMEELTAKRDDLSRKVTREEDRGLQRLAKFQVWLNRFETIEKEVIDILGTGNVQLQRLCLCGFCSKSLLSSYRYGKTVFLKLREVEKLKSEVFDVIVDQVLIPEVEERPLQPTIVGQETMLDKAWKHLMEDGVGGVMGVYGMGGVGKTTLLTQLNNKFNAARCGFDFVIWTVVSKELQVEKILNDIAQKVDLGGEMWNQKSTSQKVVHLFNFLKKKKFVLFLDDIWEKVELAEIGIPVPTPQNRCKVVFSTRSQDVCAHMGVEKPMEVQCLADNDAFDLFQKKVGQTTLGSDSGIPDLARIVAKKCCGLPLALNVIGETMSCKRTIQEWHHAIHVLNSYAAEFSGMDDKILPLLKYSYDSLKGEQVKSCLLYCALFPEDARVAKEKLIEYWICEEIIDGSEGIDKAENHGYEIIGTLVRASLLMEAATDQDGVHIVHMHDVVREMALWIASEMGIQKEAFIVRAGVGLHEIPMIKNWRVVKRMSLMNNKISHLTSRPVCIELTTLLLQSTNLEDISSEFFKSMPKLVVLDLSDNYYLYELPVISKLVSLQYLNLSGTGIRDLPTGLQELKKLIHLDLEKTRHLSSIVGLSSLDNLKVLKLSGSQFPWDHDTVKELEALEDLELVTTTIDRTPSKENILRSHRLMSCSQSLKIMNNSNLKSSEILLPAAMDKLRDFSIKCCTISEIKMGRICSFLSLVKVRIEDCKCLRELTFLMFAPNLRILFVEKANQLEDIISKEKVYEGIVPFAKLNNLHLADLPQLKNIYWSPLPFPCLQNLYVKACPNLKKLPLDSLSGKHGENGLIIGYRDMEWFCNVKWEDHATKTRFSSSSRRQGYNRIFISYVEKKWIERTRS